MTLFRVILLAGMFSYAFGMSGEDKVVEVKKPDNVKEEKGKNGDAAGAKDEGKGKSSAESFRARLEADSALELELRNKLVKAIRDMTVVMRDYDISSQSMQGISGLGRVEQLQYRAERYSAERQVRKRIEKEVFNLSTIMEEWLNCQERVKEWDRLVKIEQRMNEIRSAAARNKESAATQQGPNPQSVEYYTLKAPGTVKEVSALPEVYGNANAWKYIFDANRDKISSPEVKIPMGVTLIIPAVGNTTEFLSLD